MRCRFVLHPFLVALAPISFLLAHNIAEVFISQTLVSVAVVLGMTLVLLLIARLVFRDVQKAGIVVSLSLVLLFTYGHIAHPLNGWRAGGVLIGRPAVFLAVDAAVFGLIVWRVVCTRRNLRAISRFLTIASACFVLVSVVRVAGHELLWYSGRPVGEQRGLLSGADPAATPRQRPKIYYIILDAYARGDVLAAMYDYDNSQFLDSLRRKGFYIADASYANYAYTGWSLSSSLNATYLDKVAQQVGPDSLTRRPLRDMIRGGAVVDALRQHGYRFVTVESGYDLTTIKNADLYLSLQRTLNEFETALLNMTPIPVVLDALPIEPPRFYGAERHRRRILFEFESLANAPQMKGPTFMFVHILAPHQPFVFDEHGGPMRLDKPFAIGLPEAEAKRAEYLVPYVKQLRFINAKVTEVVDTILSTSREAPIIIIQADHGGGLTIDATHAERTNLTERMAILNAYYFPDQDYGELYRGISPVNTFRVILNKYFGANLELLPDESYFAPYVRPYAFVNVTDKLEAAEKEAVPE